MFGGTIIMMTGEWLTSDGYKVEFTKQCKIGINAS